MLSVDYARVRRDALLAIGLDEEAASATLTGRKRRPTR
jgi:hypothetical protein